MLYYIVYKAGHLDVKKPKFKIHLFKQLFFRGILLLGSSLNWASSHKGVINQRAYFYLSNEGRMRFIGIMASDLGPFYSQK